MAVVHGYSNVPRGLPDGVLTETLANEPVLLAIRSDDPLAADDVDLAELADHAWITPDRNLTCFQMADRACGLAGFRPVVVAETVDFAAQLELVRAGIGVALVPLLAVAGLPPDVTLARPKQELERHIFAVSRTSMHADPGLGTLIDALRKAADNRLRLSDYRRDGAVPAS